MGALANHPDKSMKGHKLLILTPFEPPTWFLDAVAREHPDLRVVFRKIDFAFFGSDAPAVPDDGWNDVTIFLGWGASLPTEGLAPKLQYAQLMSAGADGVLTSPLFTETGPVFCTANGLHGPQISEWVVGTWLAVQLRLFQYLELQRQQKWAWDPNASKDDAVGKRVGILGYGGIGRQVAHVTRAMGMEVYAYTLHPRDTPESKRDQSWSAPGTGDPDGIIPSRWFSGHDKSQVHEFLSSDLDLLVIAAPLTGRTTKLLGAEEFRLLGKKRTFVSNIARGGLIDTDDLVDALNQGLISGAALDVTDPEPLPAGHPLWTAKNVIITPHISGASTAYNDRALSILLHNLDRWTQGLPFANRVSKEDGY